MSVWTKLITAIRGGANEVGESIVDQNALRILDQEIRDSDNFLTQAKNELVSVMAKHQLANKRVSEFDAKISDYEKKAMAALDKGEEGLATECAGEIARLSAEQAAEKEAADAFGNAVVKLKASVLKAEAQIKTLRHQTDMARARESVQKAQANSARATGGANGRLETAVGSLNRLKLKQDQREAELDAAEQLAGQTDGTDLDARLQAAGIGATANDASDVLARLKAQRAPKPE